ncbi:MAG: ribosome small subunit-dependent GTPase A [Myxococcota bacterium]
MTRAQPDPTAEPAQEVAPDVVPTHVVVAQSRGFGWVRPMDPHTRMPLPDPPASRMLRLRPGVHVVVGDRVRVEDDLVVGVAPRANTLKRAHRTGEKLLAAHVDRMVTVLAVGRALREGFLMRTLVASTLQGVPPLVVVNKLDLDDDGEAAARVEGWRRTLGLRCITTSVVRGDGLGDLAEALSHGTSVLLGHSGVGKSSLINALRPGAQRRTGELDWQGKGKHVTTMAEAIVAPGSMLIDLPGVREFGLFDATPDEVLVAFPDVAAAMTRCRFPTCQHQGDEGCAVEEEMEAGRLDPQRVALCERMRTSVALGTEGGGRI